jgi:hypothetical protein
MKQLSQPPSQCAASKRRHANEEEGSEKEEQVWMRSINLELEVKKKLLPLSTPNSPQIGRENSQGGKEGKAKRLISFGERTL